MRFTIYQDSRQGGRANNEDRTTYCYSREALLMVVADGMGGHHYGEIASQIAVQTLVDEGRISPEEAESTRHGVPQDPGAAATPRLFRVRALDFNGWADNTLEEVLADSP